jgi:hypothetical protein
MQSRPARVARGFAAAVVSTAIAAFSHAAGGGVFPHPLILLAGILFTGMLCALLAGRRVSLARLVPSVVVTQATFHLLFSLSGGGYDLSGEGGAAGTATVGVVHVGGVHVGGVPLGAAPLAGAHVGGGPPGQLDPMALVTSAGHAASGAGMLLAHAVAAVLTILALRYGESAFWGLLDTARLMLATLLRARMPALPWAPRRWAIRAAGPGLLPVPMEGFLVGVPHRGPPSRPTI